MLLAIHLRRERRPTIRDVRSALAFLITHDLSCAEIHAERKDGHVPSARLDRLYHNAAFDGSGGPDLVLDEWTTLDPARTPSPALDRFFYFHRSPSQVHVMSRTFLSSPERALMPGLSSDGNDSRWLQSIRRRFLFEGIAIEPRPGAGELPQPKSLFPYRHFETFIDVLSQDTDRVLTSLLVGASVADGVPLAACWAGLALRTGEPRSDIVVIKRFARELFELGRPSPPRNFVESVSDRLIVRHTDGSPVLQLGLDLFEFLMRSSEGLLPGALEQTAFVEDITTFRNQLLAQPSTQVTILEVGRLLHQVALDGSKIVLRTAP